MKKTIRTIMMAVACGVLFPAAATAQSYQLVTADGQLESGKRYLIVAKHGSDYYAWNGLNTSANKGDATIVLAPEENVITPAQSVVPVQLVKSSEGWKIIDIATEKYVGTSSENSAYLIGNPAPASFTRFLWNISFDGGTTLVSNYSNSIYHYLKFDYNDGSSFFGAYGGGDKTDIALYKETGSSLILYNGRDNTDAINAAAGGTHNVILQNRTFFKDGAWNTLCLPFNVTLAESPLAGATVMELDMTSTENSTYKTRLDGTTLYLYFKTATSIEAGKPYIIKWDNANGTIDSPTFSNVEIASATNDVSSHDGSVTFKGTYTSTTYGSEDKSTLLLGTSNTLYWPLNGASIRAFRAYFKLNGVSAGVREFKLNFGDSETAGITTTNLTNYSGTWYTMDGCRLDKQPTKPGLYINNGRKVAIK